MTKQLIGYISVDSGTIMVADPCYWTGLDWNKFCDEIGQEKIHNFKHLQDITGKGTAISCDDGIYSVFLDFNEETGRKQIIIDL